MLALKEQHVFMTKLFSTILFLILVNHHFSFSQQVDFTNGYSSALNRHYATIDDMVLTNDSSLLLSGSAWYHNGIEEYFIIKADLDGNIKKIIRNDTTSDGWGEGQIIKELSNGNYLMLDFHGLLGGSDQLRYMFFDTTGHFLFQKNPYAATNITSPYDTIFRPTGLVEIQSSLYLIGREYCSSTAYDIGILIKTDLDGNVLQINQLPSVVPSQYHGAVMASHKNILIGGVLLDSVLVNRKPQFTCIDTTGNIVWQQAYNIGSTNSNVDEVCEIPGGYLLAINYASYILKVDSVGNLIWAEPQFMFSNNQMQLNYSKNYLTTGYLGTVNWSDTLGQSLTSYSASFPSLETAETIILNNNIYIAGRSYIGSGYEGYLIRISDSLLTGISEKNFPKSNIYPNPIHPGSRLYFSILTDKITSAALHTVAGNLLIPSMVIHSETTPFIDIPQSVHAGTYIITLQIASKKYMYRLVVVD